MKTKIVMVIAEFIGTFLLVLLGCLGCVTVDFVPDSLLMSINFGIAVLVAVQVVGHVSLAMINPAVALAAVIHGKITIWMGLICTFAQCIGSISAYSILQILRDDMKPRTCMTLPNLYIHGWQAFIVEIFCSFALVGSVCAIWDPRNKNYQDSSSLRIGLIVAGLCTASIPFSGASMNPARSFGPALLNNHWDYHWIYWVAPLSGGLVAALVSKFLFQLTLNLNEQKICEANKKV